MKKFLISIDTEGDNQWAWKSGDVIYTENSCYLQRFQNLCEDFGFIPTYLTNYEMAMDPRYQAFAYRFLRNETGEIGMHLHAWNTKPEYNFKAYNNPKGASYLVEYPNEIMEQKIQTMHEVLTKVFGCQIITHRAGRWAMNDSYFEILSRFGYRIDCSITPHIDWSNSPGESAGSKGSNYKMSPETPYIIDGQNSMLEVPVTIRKSHHLFPASRNTVKSNIGRFVKAFKGQYLWLRPNGKNLEQMLWLLDDVNKDDNTDYIMFMLHSSEFMPGGSPTFKTEESIEVLYKHLSALFSEASKNYEGMSIGKYGISKIESLEMT